MGLASIAGSWRGDLSISVDFQFVAGVWFANTTDLWWWDADIKGEPSVKSIRRLLELNRVPVDLNPMIWPVEVPLKVRSFAWKVRLNKIPSKVSLTARGVQMGVVENLKIERYLILLFENFEMPTPTLKMCKEVQK
ncbi:hypothetical protein QVD17_11750 [Tagetes erecta]|uniref:Reverse transcriptase zinc-binding domain-containing protein n=1 Tax=Tagetes erecta TaxID=13708 RepID=A0AAD8KU20_TARER|nr:hypothetical protein QVD17_11750 [Tagetes erecta]